MNKHCLPILILLGFFTFPTIVLANHCGQFTSEVFCSNNSAHCAWNTITRSCGLASDCTRHGEAGQCNAAANCSWNTITRSCGLASDCTRHTEAAVCNADTNCAWNSIDRRCGLSNDCSRFGDAGICNGTPGCAWSENTRRCASSTSGSQTNVTAPGASAGQPGQAPGASAGQPGQNVVQLQNPLGEGRTDLRAIIGEVIQKVLTVLGSITLLVFIAGGVMWLTSGGSEEKVAKGSKTMLYAAIGIAVIFAAYAILNTVIKTLTGAG